MRTDGLPHALFAVLLEDAIWVFDGAQEVRQGSNRWDGSCVGRGVSEGRSPDVVGGDEMYEQDAKMERLLICLFVLFGWCRALGSR